MNNTQQMMEDMKKITMLTGEISSIHELNLKNWIFVAFDGVQELEIKYDLTKDRTKETGEGFVEFYLKVKTDTENNMLKQRCETLTGWVRNMFWKEIKIKVYINDVCQYTNSSKED